MLLSTRPIVSPSALTIITVKTTSNVRIFSRLILQKLKHTVGTSPFFARVGGRILRFCGMSESVCYPSSTAL